jgi:hypothetical protein
MTAHRMVSGPSTQVGERNPRSFGLGLDGRINWNCAMLDQKGRVCLCVCIVLPHKTNIKRLVCAISSHRGIKKETVIKMEIGTQEAYHIERKNDPSKQSVSALSGKWNECENHAVGFPCDALTQSETSNDRGARDTIATTVVHFIKIYNPSE